MFLFLVVHLSYISYKKGCDSFDGVTMICLLPYAKTATGSTQDCISLGLNNF